jgi:hypothetical protein
MSGIVMASGSAAQDRGVIGELAQVTTVSSPPGLA